MRLTKEEQKIVEENMGLVHKVIQDKIHGWQGSWLYEDIFQIGCIGLCKAAATDRGGTFSTYAYRLIQNEISNAMISETRKQAKEILADVTPYQINETSFNAAVELYEDLKRSLLSVRKEASPTVIKGIDALILLSLGYTNREIGEQMGATANLVCAWVSKARKFLQSHPEIRSMAA